MEPLGAADPVQVGPYQLRGRLAAATIGKVYLGRALDGGPAAVTVVHAWLAHDPAFREGLRRWVRAARTTGEAFTVPIVDADPEAEIPWLATAHLEAPSLARLVAEHGPLPVGSVRELGRRLIEALESAHAAGVVHGGLSPSEVLMLPQGPQPVHFGTAAVVDLAATRTDAADEAPAFLCPERLLGTTLTGASDVYGVGAVLCFAAAGQPPFGSVEIATAYQRAATYQRIVHEEPDLSAVPDPVLRAVIADCLAKDPAARPTPGRLARQLHEAVTAPGGDAGSRSVQDVLAVPFAPPPAEPPVRPVAAAPVLPTAPPTPPVAPPVAPPTPPAAPPMPTVPPQYAPPPHRPAGGRRRVWIAALAGALALAVAAVVGIVAWPGGHTSSSQAGSRSHAAVPNGKAGFTWAVSKAKGGVGNFVGLWSTPSSVVLGTDVGGLVGYDAATGAQLWSWKPPAGGLPLLCGMSDSSSDGVGAFTYGSQAVDGVEQCDHLQTVSVATGKLGWAEAVSLVGAGASHAPTPQSGTSLSISGGVVTAPYAGSRTRDQYHQTTDFLTVDAKSGRVRWSTDYGGGPTPDGCRLSGQAQALQGTVYAIGQCTQSPGPALLVFSDSTSSRTSRILGSDSLLDGQDRTNSPPTGLDPSEFTMTADADHLVIGYGSLSDPLREAVVVSAGTDEVSVVDLTSVDADRLGGGSRAAHLPANLLLDKDTMYMLHKGNGPGDDGVVAIDLLSGHQQWSRTLPGADSVALLGATDSGVDVLASGTGGASLYTVTGSGQSAGPAPNAEQLKAFAKATGEQAPRGVRVGGYLAVGFPGPRDDGDTVVLGVMPTGGA
ncbi:serine/threonine-protein kinase [Kitasatospora kifunensis]|uniref:Protein kinase domain-containing protein n=1 Tax=Kitasatospora kifunensis TaxID=58351 RepID=A0A7W7VZS7_KITKI|nr:serine/threonine-protein kinase [Kitasatospora kifunensis]MBB4928034.1 hypothetical protein [Kitasatospora kifunensis]